MHIRKAHVIGIGGVGMSATAKLLRDSGVIVSGSDEAVYPPISTMLEEAGLSYQTPYKASNLPEDVDLIVIGKNAKLVPETNEEVRAAYASGKLIQSFPEVLAGLAENREVVVVAGSYGKSTSTAMLAHCLESAGLDPSYFIGALPLSPQTSSRLGTGKLFVLEGDEYPASNTDNRSKFLLMNPSHVLLTPLAHDHKNVFPTEEDYLQPFLALEKMLPQDATLVVSESGALSQEYIRRIGRTPVTYGLHKGDYSAKNIVWGEVTSFDIVYKDTVIVRAETTQLGEHNVENLVGVAAFVFTHKLLTPEEFAKGSRTFKGVIRRMDKKSDKTTLPIFEGFGSSYEKARSAIAAMKLHFADKRLVVVFEPNTIGWRSRTALSQYDDAFLGANEVYVFEPPHDGKETELSSEEIATHINVSGIPAHAYNTPEKVLEALEKNLVAEDAILLLSSGPMGGLVEGIPQLAEKLFPR